MSAEELALEAGALRNIQNQAARSEALANRAVYAATAAPMGMGAGLATSVYPAGAAGGGLGARLGGELGGGLGAGLGGVRPRAHSFSGIGHGVGGAHTAAPVYNYNVGHYGRLSLCLMADCRWR